MFVTLEKIAQTDPKYADIFLLENYAAFQNRYFLFFWQFHGFKIDLFSDSEKSKQNLVFLFQI